MFYVVSFFLPVAHSDVQNFELVLISEFVSYPRSLSHILPGCPYFHQV